MFEITVCVWTENPDNTCRQGNDLLVFRTANPARDWVTGILLGLKI
jgi:hypothetical protein